MSRRKIIIYCVAVVAFPFWILLLLPLMVTDALIGDFELLDWWEDKWKTL